MKLGGLATAPYSVPVHVRLNIPDKLAALNPSATVNSPALIRSPWKHECLQESPIILPDHRILRKAQDGGSFFYRVPLLWINGIQYEHVSPRLWIPLPSGRPKRSLTVATGGGSGQLTPTQKGRGNIPNIHLFAIMILTVNDIPWYIPVRYNCWR